MSWPASCARRARSRTWRSRSCARPTRAAARTTSRSSCSGWGTARTLRGAACPPSTRRSPARSRWTTSSPRPPPSRPPAPAPPSRPAGSGTRPRRRLRVGMAARVVVGLVLVAGVVAGLYALSRQVYFVATNDGGLVTLYRGVPYELPFGIDLYEQEYASGVPARAIPTARRGAVLDHSWRSREDATDLVRELERGNLDPGAGER